MKRALQYDFSNGMVVSFLWRLDKLGCMVLTSCVQAFIQCSLQEWRFFEIFVNSALTHGCGIRML